MSEQAKAALWAAIEKHAGKEADATSWRPAMRTQ